MAHSPIPNPIETYVPRPLKPPASIRDEAGEFDAIADNWKGTNCAILRSDVLAVDLQKYRSRVIEIILTRSPVPSLERFAADVDNYCSAFGDYRSELERIRVKYKSLWLETTYERDISRGINQPALRMIPKSPRVRPAVEEVA